MKLGLLTAPFENTPLTEVAAWAASVGYEQLEVACWPQSGAEARRYAGTAHLPIEDMTAKRGTEIVGELADLGISISALGYYPNNLHPDESVRTAANEHTKAVIRAASLMGVPMISTFIGADHTRSLEENYARALQVFPEIVAYAAEHDVRIAIENCPMIFSADEWPSGKNLAYNPVIWRRMFEDFEGGTLGLNLDPSHLHWLMIDPQRVVREFADRIYHVHIKDLEIDREGLYENGSMSAGVGWQVPRLPGLGEVDWARFVAALYRAGYDGVLCVEHEDRDFEGSDGLVKKGFIMARDVIRPLVPLL
ncbi:sugar phosphate isomerase/epimerase family protein [Pseudactinotalea sp. Z1739]|uniref:sugar phosphate isomerase/epimerase family protein n=1 Tax=Pseudactinotalea sp. Z1739 TaxID=3413028 RepID=UPI003C7DD03A